MGHGKEELEEQEGWTASGEGPANVRLHMGCQKGLETPETPRPHLPTPPPVYLSPLGKSFQRQRNCLGDLGSCCPVGTRPLSPLQKEGL